MAYEDEDRKFRNSVILAVISATLGSIGSCVYRNVLDPEHYRYIPNTEQVQQGYTAPSKLEIKCKDLDENGEPETIMRVGDKSYLLREVDGKPVLSAYEVKVVPKE